MRLEPKRKIASLRLGLFVSCAAAHLSISANRHNFSSADSGTAIADVPEGTGSCKSTSCLAVARRSGIPAGLHRRIQQDRGASKAASKRLRAVVPQDVIEPLHHALALRGRDHAIPQTRPAGNGTAPAGSWADRGRVSEDLLVPALLRAMCITSFATCACRRSFVVGYQQRLP